MTQTTTYTCDACSQLVGSPISCYGTGIENKHYCPTCWTTAERMLTCNAPLELAKKLQQERDAAKAEASDLRTKLKTVHDNFEQDVVLFRQERDEAREAAEMHLRALRDVESRATTLERAGAVTAGIFVKTSLDLIRIARQGSERGRLKKKEREHMGQIETLANATAERLRSADTSEVRADEPADAELVEDKQEDAP